MLLRISKFLNRSTTELEIEFSDDLSKLIGITNIDISSGTINTLGLIVKSIIVDGSILRIQTSPQFPFAFYTLKLQSTASQVFESINGNRMQEDGVNNAIQFLGLENINPVRDDIFDALSPVYNVEEPTFIRDNLSSISERLYAGRNDIRETGNANYINVDVVDELKRRGYSATDRLANEGAFKVIRVGLLATGATAIRQINFNAARAVAVLDSANSSLVSTQITSFSGDPFSLRTISIIRENVSNSEQLINKFEDLIITLSKSNISQIHAIRLKKSNGSTIVYDITNYGYAIQNNRYDTTHGNRLITLDSNQFRLTEAAIFDATFEIPTGDDTVEVSYSYIDNGVNVDVDTITVTQVIEVIRQSVPSLLTIFSLGKFPIVTSADIAPLSAGVTFLDPSPPSGSPFTQTHPAFANEIVFSETRLPAAPGEYSIEYTTGRVFVYGAVIADGAGTAPPVASYFYRKSFVEGIDYDFESDADEIAANVTRSLIGKEVKIVFNYEQILADGIDYLGPVHAEVINENVENNFYGPNEIRTLNNPITNVFRLFNATTGENYAMQRFTDNAIFIDGRQLPRTEKITNELATFERAFNEAIEITENAVLAGSYKIVRIDLKHNNIISETENFVGSNINTSVILGDSILFLREFFYDSVLQSVAINLAKLTVIGDYLINYSAGVVYVRLNIETTDLGDVSYTYGAIRTLRPRILSVDEIGYRATVKDEAVKTFDIASFTSELITPSNLESAGERFLVGDSDKPILFGAKQYGLAGQRNVSSNIFIALDALFDSSHADGNHFIRFPDDSDRLILQVISSTSVRVDLAFTDTERSVSWCLLDADISDGYQTITSYDIISIRGVYSVSELQTLDKDSLTNFFDPNLDTFSGNTITFNSTGIGMLSAGDGLVIDYSYGNLYAQYDYLFDNLVISYEHGNNSIDFSIGDAIAAGQDYFVSYSYGALREALLTNFGSLTQLEELATFPLDFDRELYRDAVSGALQSFMKGPTVQSVETIISSITNVIPDVRELTFNEWTLGRDNLYLRPAKLTGTETYVSGKFNDGLYIGGSTTLEFPAEAYISLREGTFEGWLTPDWRGLDNDSTLTFDIGVDGYSAGAGTGLVDGYQLSLADIYIGESAYNPTAMPFSIHRLDLTPDISVGRPTNYGTTEGYFIWYDVDENQWKVRLSADPQNLLNFTGTITSTGQFYNVRDGYNVTTGLFVNELNDSITSTDNYIRFNTLIGLNEGLDGYDGYIGSDGYDGYYSQDGIDFLSDDLHYIYDTGPSLTHNRLSLFKDGFGYLNFRAYDRSGQVTPGTAKIFNISHDISNWAAGEIHFLSTSWRFNSAQGIDEMHLFVDGQEVSNNFKYGGRPIASQGTDIYRTVASESVTASAVKNIILAQDGVSTASSAVFISSTAGFLTNGIIPTDTINILDATADGAGSPYTILTVDSDVQVTLTTTLLLTLNNVSFSINQLAFIASTELDTEKIAVFADDGYSIRELDGIGALIPDYTLTRSSSDNILTINNNVNIGDSVFINTLGLIRGRVRDIIFDYNTDNIFRTNLVPPYDLNHIDVYKYIFRRTAIEDDGYALLGSGFFQDNTSSFDGYFTEICQPSNTTVGKTFRVTLHGTTDIDFTGTNTVTIEGAPSSEVLSFTNYGSLTTSTLFTSTVSITFAFTPSMTYDGYGSLGAIELIEAVPLTQSEAAGDYAVTASYNNGNFTFQTFGSGGAPFNLESCYYLLDYPTALNININQKGSLYLGSDLNGVNQLDGTLDEVIILNDMLSDIRSGEVPPSTQRTITQDFNSILQIEQTPQTMMQLKFDGNLNNIDKFYTTYNEEYFTTSKSVNIEFGDAAVLLSKAILLDNGQTIFNNNEGTIEFWISPMIDTLNDMDATRYYIDIVSAQTTDTVSTTAITITLPQRARKVESVRLTTDAGSGTDFFVGGSLGVDGRTIRLGKQLPAQSTLVRIGYIPVDLQGDRVSLYKDGYGSLNFEIKASESVFQISYPIVWSRNTWHRVMVTWDLNNPNNQDRIRMFVDGIEGGSVLYGTPGVLYGIGILYGTASVVGSSFLTTNIDLLDTFSDVLLGNNRDGTGPAMVRMDNVRISNFIREPAIVANINVDLNFNANRDAALPVIEDDKTTILLDFNKEITETQFLANGLRRATPLFLFDVDVVDSFNRINGNIKTQELIESLITRLKPTHSKAFLRFL